MRDCGVGDFTDTSLSGEVSPVVVGPSGSHRPKSVRSKDVEFGPHLVQDLFVALLALWREPPAAKLVHVDL